jgi:hypothetical protein
MASGVSAHESKKRAAQAALFLRSTLSVLDNRPEQIERTDDRCAPPVMAPLRHAEGRGEVCLSG